MEGIEFEKDTIGYASDNYMIKNQKGSVFAKFLVNKGIVKNESQANTVMLVLGVIFIIISLFLISKSLKGQSSKVEYRIPQEALQRFSPEIQEAISKQSR